MVTTLYEGLYKTAFVVAGYNEWRDIAFKMEKCSQEMS